MIHDSRTHTNTIYNTPFTNYTTSHTLSHTYTTHTHLHTYHTPQEQEYSDLLQALIKADDEEQAIQAHSSRNPTTNQ
jgi:hypothetical protein